MRPSRFQYAWLVLLLIIVGSSVHLGFNPLSIFSDSGNSLTIISEMLTIDLSVGDKIVSSLVETLEMALIGSSLGFALSIPTALLAARNISPSFVSMIFRSLLAVLWSMPPLLWAILLVVIVGLGPTAGIFAIMFYIMGLSGKYLYEIYESQNHSAYDAMHVIGATRMQIARFVTIPEALPHMSNQYLFLLAYSVKESSILGLVGAGGIGFYIIHHLESLNYGKAAPFILAILAVILGMDFVSSKLRKRLVYH